MMKIISIIHIFLCMVLGYGEWYLIFWLVSTTPNPLEWGIWVKIVYCFLSMVATESYIKSGITLTIKKRKDE